MTTTEPPSLISDQDLFLFNEGSHFRLWDKLGSHPVKGGTRFAVWAPNAEWVSVIGDHNGWDGRSNPLQPRGSSGIWEGFVPGVGPGAIYKYQIRSRNSGYRVDKADPFAFRAEEPPKTGSIVWELNYDWDDADWMRDRHQRNSAKAPLSIYEMHIGSWMRVPEEGNRSLFYWELSGRIADYCDRTGFTHVELLPLMDHPFFRPWGYQTTGYFAPTSRYGTPQDFMMLVDSLHKRGVGIILDWVPSHFPTDEHGLAYFDGTHLYEHADPRKGMHKEWGSYAFNYGRSEVQSFLISSALFWLDRYHADGLRVDAVASMLYLDYARKAGEWIPNQFGGRENLEAIDFLRRFNLEAYKEHPDIQTIAEESTSYPMVSRPTHLGGLGFGLKWDMGWMHDTLEYFSHDPIYRQYHHNSLTFRMLYSFHENFVLPLSHDEIVHGKGALINKMPGDDWQKFANLRLLFAYMFAQPGKKLLFMGGEFGQYREWSHDRSLDWNLLEGPLHRGLLAWMEQLNRAYRAENALHWFDNDPQGFEWVDCNDAPASVISLLRKGQSENDAVLVACNFTPVPRVGYKVGVPSGGYWKEILNSDAREYGGSGVGNMGGAEALTESVHGRPYSLRLTLPPLGAVFLKKS